VITAITGRISTLLNASVATTQRRANMLTDEQVTHMVNRFLAWKLPTDFSPDDGISFEKVAGASGPHPFTREPVGTNLLTFTQAKAMVQHMIDGMPSS